MLSQMEDDLGMGEMSNSEKQVLMAVFEIQEKLGFAKTKTILNHDLTKNISRPSIFRALKQLENMKRIVKLENEFASYTIPKNVESDVQ
jgi:Mn-dependent DtxR family transcriptional regulator